MKRKIITTKDGSKTIYIEEWNEQYHSIHGAIQEAKYVFLKHGLAFKLSQIEHINSSAISILEIGFGTGLNAFLTFLKSQKSNITIKYTGIEAYPVSLEDISKLNYPEAVEEMQQQSAFLKMHSCAWEKPCPLSKQFTLLKVKSLFKELNYNQQFDIIYFDAFGARVQPELWEAPIFNIMFKALKQNGVLVTYSAKGSARRAMQSVGFQVEKLPGPPGKREMLRAIK